MSVCARRASVRTSLRHAPECSHFAAAATPSQHQSCSCLCRCRRRHRRRRGALTFSLRHRLLQTRLVNSTTPAARTTANGQPLQSARAMRRQNSMPASDQPNAQLSAETSAMRRLSHDVSRLFTERVSGGCRPRVCARARALAAEKAASCLIGSSRFQTSIFVAAATRRSAQSSTHGGTPYVLFLFI